MSDERSAGRETEHCAAQVAPGERRFSAIIEGFRDPIVIVDARHVVRYVNKAFTTVLGHTPSSVLARPFRDLLHPDEASATLAGFTSLADARSAPREHRVLRADGTWDIAEIAASPLFDPTGRPALVLHVHSVRQRKELEARLSQSQRMEILGRLAGSVAHDFNNLLTVILGTVDITMSDLAERDELRAPFATIHAAAARAASLTRQLLAFSRKQVLKPVVVNLDAIVRDLTPMLRRLIGENISVRIETGNEAWSVRVDPAQMDQVVLNLAVNARDAMPDGGTLTIRVENVPPTGSNTAVVSPVRAGPHVMLTVEDTGTGMDEATVEKIFEPFFTTKANGHGSGLGLATVYGIVEQSGGEIVCQSAPGRGTAFHIHFPRVDETPQPAPPPEAPAATDGRETILVVDDDPDLRPVARKILEKGGYTVLLACGGEEALRLMRLHGDQVALVVTDVVMPGMGGPELAEKLEELRPGTRVVFVTGYTAGVIAEERLLDESANVLVKPYTRETLSRAVRRALDSV